MLSIGCSPVVTNQEQTLSADQSTEWGTKLQNRADETERAMMARELLFTRVQYSLEDETTFPAFRPLDFVNWLYKSKLPHPKELFEAVQRQHSGEVSDVREPARYVFRRKEQAWEVRFGDVVLDGVKDLLGMTFIQLLLQNTGSLDVSEMQALAGASPTTVNTGGRVRGDRGAEQTTPYDSDLREHGEAGDDILDDEARRQYRQEIERLEDQLEIADDTGDKAAAARIRQDIAAFQQQLLGATGLRGRSRQLNPLSEKHRKSTAKAIDQAIDNIRSLETRIGREAVMLTTLPSASKKGQPATTTAPAAILP